MCCKKLKKTLFFFAFFANFVQSVSKNVKKTWICSDNSLRNSYGEVIFFIILFFLRDFIFKKNPILYLKIQLIEYW